MQKDGMIVIPMEEKKIAVIGTGYVGLPLAIEFGKQYITFGFDINSIRCDQLAKGIDANKEFSQQDIKQAPKLIFTCDLSDIAQCNVYIITVPTPVDAHHKPNLDALLGATNLVSSVLKRNDIVIYESTVYPGATEEDCLPILETKSGLVVNKDFGLGYSPERVNPGDKSNPITSIVKVTSGSNEKWAQEVDDLYSSIILAGTHRAESIKVAESAKIVENVQRDLNIALINQLAQLFSVLEIDTHQVIKAASTKWNFTPYTPGLVGGHCIGVDPYYLCHKAESVGYIPDIILAGRRLNDSMGEFIANRIIKLLTKHAIAPHLANILVLGITFKENCSDIRNTKVPDVIHELERYHCNVSVFDPIADKNDVKNKLEINLVESIDNNLYDFVFLAVPHQEILDIFSSIQTKMKRDAVIYDLKSVLPINNNIERL